MDFQNKKDIRKHILERRDKIELGTRSEWDESIFSKLITSEFYKNSKVLFSFVSFGSEVDTHQIINQALKDSKTICVPRIESKEKGMEIFKINSLDELKTGYFGILEPMKSCPAIDPESIDLILMPGVAFDKQGGRVGYGRGFYDNFLRKMNKKVDKIALSYDFQLLDKVPMDEFDVRIDGIITEKQLYTTSLL